MVLNVVLAGIQVGVEYTILGYVKNLLNKDKTKEAQTKKEFSWKKFGRTIIIGMIVGGIAASQGMPVEASFTDGNILLVGATFVADNLVKWVQNAYNKYVK